MKKLILFSTILLTMAFSGRAIAQNDTIAALYDFENLVNGNLNGQDNWSSTIYNSAIDFRVADTVASHPTRVLFYNQSGPSVGVDGSREFDSTFPGFDFDNKATVYILEFEVKRNYWGFTIGLAADINNDGKTLKTNTNELAFTLTTGSLNGEVMALPNGTTYSLGNTFGTTWQSVQILINPFNGINGGTFTVGRKLIGAPFYTNLVFNAPLYADTLSLGKSNITRWNMFFMHSEGANAIIDNIRLTKVTPAVTSLSENQGPAFSAYYYDHALHVGKGASEKLDVQIIDASGRELKKSVIEGSEFVSLYDLKQGWYCANITGKTGAVRVPFYVQ
jgi:hypothetical protein